MAQDNDAVMFAGQIDDPDNAGTPLTRGRYVEILTADLDETAQFVADGRTHWHDNGDAMHLLAGLAALHDATHRLAEAITHLVNHDQQQTAIDDVIVEVTIPETVPAEWSA